MTVYSYLITILKKYNKSIDDIQWIGCKDFQIVKDDFFAYIQEKEYKELELDLPYDLLIVGKDFGVEINDFGDIFVYKSLPERPNKTINLKYLSTSNISEDEMENLKNSIHSTYDTAWVLYTSLNSDNNTFNLLKSFDEFVKADN